MKIIPAGQFRARCLRVMEDVRATRETVVVTKKGKPVAKMVPADAKPQDMFGCLAGIFEIVGDTESAVSKLGDWKVLR